MGRVDGKTAIVTGGAAGLGQAIAQMLAREGANVVIADVDEARGAETAAAIGAAASFSKLDVCDEAAWKALIGETVSTHGGLHILVNNAGIAPPGNPENTDLETWRRVQQVNGEGVFLGCKHAMAAIHRSSGGSIVNLSSIAALVATPFLSAYGASKAAVRQLSQSIALHCAEQGYRVRCNTVHPGQIQTEMLDGLFAVVAEDAGISLEDAEAAFVAKIPMGEFGDADDIAYAVLYLASDESKHVTGTQLVIDGGMSLNP